MSRRLLFNGITRTVHTRSRFFGTLVDTLSTKQHAVLDREIQSLDRTERIIGSTRFDGVKNDTIVVQNSKRDLSEFFLMATIGEFNVGKSSFLNTLLGKRVLPEGVTPTTSKINFIRYGEKYEEEEGEVRNIRIPVDWLKSCVMVDTPGLNSMYKDHQKITSDFIPRSDIVFFLTSATQVFNKTEKDFIEYIREWNKRAVLVISRKDQLETTEDLTQVTKFLSTHFEKEFGYLPQVFAVSSKVAFQSFNSPDPVEQDRLYKLSGFKDLEDYIKNVLTDTERVKVKFLNGINMCDRMLQKYNGLCQGIIKELDLKMTEVADLEITGQQYVSEMKSYLELNYKDIDRVLWDMRVKACNLIDEAVTIGNFRILFNQKRFSEKFAKDVIDDINTSLERKINYMVDYFSEKNDQFLKKVRTDLINKFSSIKGLDYTSRIEKDRQDIINKSVGSFATEYNRVEEIAKIVDDIRNAFWTTITMELAAIFGVGAVAQICSALMLPIEPVFFASAGVGVGVLGLGILPWKRRKLKEMIEQKSTESSKKLRARLDDYFQNEINRNLARINSVIEPHHLIVKSDKEKFTSLITQIGVELAEIENIKKVIDHV